jgi:signal transduction histidine kinase
METFAFVARSFSPWTCLLALASTACLVVAMLAVRRSRHLSRELEQHRTHAQMLEMAHEQVQREAEHKEHLTAYLAHETNNLIMAVQGSHALMASDAQRAAEIRATEAVDSSANALSALLQVTRDHAQASAGQFEPCLRRLDLQSLIQRIAREFEPMAWHKKLALAAEPAPLPLFVTNDEIRVGQIVRTLVANAIKYTRDGGILLRAFRVDEQEARIEVIDSGTGIPLEQLTALFKPAGHATTPGPAAKGVGLGLALSREVAALLGGDLRARTSDGMGYEFTLVLHDYWCELGQPGRQIAV